MKYRSGFVSNSSSSSYIILGTSLTENDVVELYKQFGINSLRFLSNIFEDENIEHVFNHDDGYISIGWNTYGDECGGFFFESDLDNATIETINTFLKLDKYLPKFSQRKISLIGFTVSD